MYRLLVYVLKWLRFEGCDFRQWHFNTDQFQEDRLKLNLHKNEEGLYEFRGRLQGSYPTYLPPDDLLTEKMVHDAHVLSLHGEVGLTMRQIRQEYWVPRLRRLTKKVIRGCYGCKKFQVAAFANPPTASLPTDRTEGSVPFEVLGVDFAGPIAYKLSRKKEGKACILLFACSLTRAIHLELLPNQMADEVLRSLKRFIARRGRPRKIYSDNGSSFTAAAKWLSKVMKLEQLQNQSGSSTSAVHPGGEDNLRGLWAFSNELCIRALVVPASLGMS